MREDKVNQIIPDDLGPGTYNIGFNENDETQFYADNANDLRGLWEGFCNENDLDPECIDYCEFVESRMNLEISLVLTSGNTFDVDIYEPESGEFLSVCCHDNGNIQEENERVMREIRSWVSVLREREKEI